ncbi:MAG TPA: hypothetical protein VGN26_19835 [Armatimonadota bacterium]|jgi:hypothetical protein
MNSELRRGPIIATIVVLVVLVVGLQLAIDPNRHYYRTGKSPKEALETPKELFGGAMLGFREVAAGLLWVKADDYFHSGRYDEIVPLLYIVTWLDPHQLEVYSTGAWHLAYNLGDQRLIPEAVKFLKKGIEDNPSVYDIYFQLAWLNYHKIRNYPEALKWGEIAETKQNSDDPKKPLPYWVPNFVCHMMEKSGMYAQSIERWKKLTAESERTWKSHPGDNNLYVEYATRKHNLDTNILRLVLRENVGKPGYRFERAAPGQSLWVPSGDNQAHPVQTNFSLQVKRIAPRRLRVVGHLEMPDWRYENHENYLTLTVTIRDKGYDKLYAAHRDDFQWQKQNLTLYSRDVSFPTDSKKRNEFVTELDLSVDPFDPEGPRDPKKLFPFKSPEYEVSVFFDPARQGPYVQDGLGWLGEGYQDKDSHIDPKRGIRVLEKDIILRRDQIL